MVTQPVEKHVFCDRLNKTPVLSLHNEFKSVRKTVLLWYIIRKLSTIGFPYMLIAQFRSNPYLPQNRRLLISDTS